MAPGCRRARRPRVEADSTDLVAERGAAQQDPVEGRRDERQQGHRVERRAAGIPGSEIRQGRQPQLRPEGPRFEGTLAGGDQYLDHKPGHQRRGDEVEHDRRDNEMTAAPRLQ